MKIGILAAAFLAAATGGAAAAQEAQATPEAPQKEKKICRTEKATGSLTRRTRVCLTEAQWRELNARTKRGMDEMQRSAAGGQAVANNPGG